MSKMDIGYLMYNKQYALFHFWATRAVPFLIIDVLHGLWDTGAPKEHTHMGSFMATMSSSN